MRVLVLEYVSGGGLAKLPQGACPPSLVREGAAMRAALLEDLARIPGLQLTATADPRLSLATPPGVQVVPVREGLGRVLPRLLAQTDAAWAIAPETGGRLARLARRIEAAGSILLGPSSSAIRAAADKLALQRRLARAGLPVPPTRALSRDYGFTAPAPGPPSARRAQPTGSPAAFPPLPFPLVLKPARGAGCEGVALARDASEWPHALACARAVGARGRVLAQGCIAGAPVSVSLVTDGRRAVPLAVNAQHVRPGVPFAYAGGETPLAHPLAARALARALQACAAVSGLRGYVGVDLVLTAEDAFVIEINPRLTTSYLGIRRALDVNPAALALEAALGSLPAQTPSPVRRVRFDAAGAILEEQALPGAAPRRTRAADRARTAGAELARPIA